METLLELMSSGMSFEDILDDYPDLEREDLLAVLAFAADVRGEFDNCPLTTDN